MDKILTIFDPLPPLDGQIWTFLALFSYVQMDIVDICQPPSLPNLVHVVIERPLMSTIGSASIAKFVISCFCGVASEPSITYIL